MIMTFITYLQSIKADLSYYVWVSFYEKKHIYQNTNTIFAQYQNMLKKMHLYDVKTTMANNKLL